jgi:hypothetical protein
MKVECICKTCNACFFEYQSRIEQGRGKFCSRKCFQIDWSKRIPGWNKGKPAPWSVGNQHRKGKGNPNPHKMTAEENPAWKGDNVSYRGLHNWVTYHLGSPSKCEHCKNDKLRPRQYHWANKSGNYLRKLDDWIRLCAKCHKAYDKK